jgi:hypothetical protein
MNTTTNTNPTPAMTADEVRAILRRAGLPPAPTNAPWAGRGPHVKTVEGGFIEVWPGEAANLDQIERALRDDIVCVQTLRCVVMIGAGA